MSLGFKHYFFRGSNDLVATVHFQLGKFSQNPTRATVGEKTYLEK